MKGKLIMTVEQAADRVAWERIRKSGIGGSDVAAIMGLNPWKSAYTLYAEKRGEVEAEDLSEKESVYWGTVLEQVVADRFCELAGKKVRKCGTLKDENYDFMLANVDRLVVGEDAGLECKTTNSFNKKEWEGDNVPDAYYCQCQWYMMVTGFSKWYIACLIGGNKFVWKEISRNEKFIEEMSTAAIIFWNNLEQGVPPELDGSESTAETVSKITSAIIGPDEVALGSAAAPFIQRYNELCTTEKVIKEQKAQCQNSLLLLLNGAQCGTFQNFRVSNKAVKGRTTIDTKALKKDLPDVYEKYAKVGKESFRFGIKEV